MNDSVKDSTSEFGMLNVTIGEKEHLVLKDSKGEVLCKVRINNRFDFTHGNLRKVPIVIEAPRDTVIIRREPN